MATEMEGNVKPKLKVSKITFYSYPKTAFHFRKPSFLRSQMLNQITVCS